MQRVQQQLEFDLPDGTRERRAALKDIRAHRFRLIEALEHGDFGLTRGQRRRVVFFLKALMKADWSGWDGTCTVYQNTPAQRRSGDTTVCLCDQFCVAGKSVANWLNWSRQANAVLWSVDTDQWGVRRTTIEITWPELARAVGLPVLPESVTKPTDQTETVSDQTETVSDQTETVSDQTETVSVSYTSVSPVLSSSSTTGEHAAADEVLKAWQVAHWYRRELIDTAIAHGRSAEYFRRALQIYAKHRSQFKSLGAVQYLLRHDAWPVDGIPLPRPAPPPPDPLDDLRGELGDVVDQFLQLPRDEYRAFFARTFAGGAAAVIDTVERRSYGWLDYLRDVIKCYAAYLREVTQ